MLVLVLFINPVGASEVDPGCIEMVLVFFINPVGVSEVDPE